jgi:hypothetical protein
MNLHVLWITSALDKTFSNFSPSLEEVFQQTRYCRVNSHGTVSTSHASLSPTSETHQDNSDQQPGQQIKCINPYPYQHFIKKLPQERERYWNNIQSDII